MSIEVMNAVWRNSKSSGRQKLVLLAIADHQGEQGAWPSIATIARMVNASERSVQRDIQDLVGLGELLIEPQSAPGFGPYRANRYWVTLDGVTGVTDSTSGVTKNDLRGDTVGVLTLNRNLKEPRYPQDELEAGFQEFWKFYPRRVEKIAAKRAFVKALEVVDLETILAGVKRLAEDPNLPPKQYIKHPASWLNCGGWEDEPFPPRELTPEEKQARDRALAEERRQQALAENARQRAENEKAKAEAAPAPKCVHGKTLVLCRVCLQNVGSQQ